MTNVKKILVALQQHYNCKNFKELAAHFGVKENTLYSWVGRNRIGSPELILSKHKEVSLGFLQTGEGPVLDGQLTAPPPKIQATATNTPPNIRQPLEDRRKPISVPIISWVQASGWEYVEDPYQPGQADEWIESRVARSPHSFALVVSGDSMEPEFCDGDVVVVDPGADAGNKDFVVAKNGAEATFKQLVIDGDRKYLKPLNPRYPVIDGVGFRVVGVVVEKRKRYR